jgi:hypothetical protein
LETGQSLVAAWNAHDLDPILAHYEDAVEFWGVNSIVLCYTNQKGTRTGEFMELSPNGKVTRVVANYSA